MLPDTADPDRAERPQDDAFSRGMPHRFARPPYSSCSRRFPIRPPRLAWSRLTATSKSPRSGLKVDAQ